VAAAATAALWLWSPRTTPRTYTTGCLGRLSSSFRAFARHGGPHAGRLHRLRGVVSTLCFARELAHLVPSEPSVSAPDVLPACQMWHPGTRKELLEREITLPHVHPRH